MLDSEIILSAIDLTDNGHQFKNTTFYCVYCFDRNDIDNSVSGTIDSVYEHWFFNHTNESISAQFKFYAIPLANCFHCNEIGIYGAIEKHHNLHHKGHRFAITDHNNPKQCGICQFKCDDMMEHFKWQHNLNSQPRVFNPILYSEQKIAELLTINVHKTHQCGDCNQKCENRIALTEHYVVSHREKTVNYIETIDNKQSVLAHFFCGFCKQTVECNRFLAHFREHSYNFHCSQCPFQSDNIAELICHEKSVHKIDSLNYHCSIFPGWVKNKFFNTEMVFSNGLTLNTYNVLETKFDDSKLFDIFIDGYLEVKREHARTMIEMNDKSGNSIYNFDRSNIQSKIETISASVSIPTPKNVNQFESSTNSSSQSESETVSSNESSQNDELHKQQKLGRSIYVHGVPVELKTKDLCEVFLKICRKLRMKMHRSAIDDIVQLNDGIAIKFRHMSTKNQIINNSNGQYIWSSILFPTTKYRTAWKVYIRNHMTPYYHNIYNVAVDMKRRNYLYSYKFNEQGFVVKRSANCCGQIIQTKQQLLDYVGTK